MMGNMSASKMVSSHQKLIFRGLEMCRYQYKQILLVFFKKYVQIFLDKLYIKKREKKTKTSKSITIQDKPSTKSKIFNNIFQFLGYLSFAGAVHRFLKAKILYSQLSRSLEIHVQGTFKINNSIKQCLILENNFYFCEYLFLSLDSIKKPLHRLNKQE